MSEYIPLEVQEEILKRLPLKPLIQFRSVSKPWKSLIDSPEFIAAYGVRQTHPNRFILRYKQIPAEYRYLTFVDNDDDYTFTRQEFAPAVPDIIKDIEPRSIVVGSSHGLLCFSGHYKFPDGSSYKYDATEIVVLWNLSISKSIGIEVPYMHDSTYFVADVTGFGVCPVTFDPTIVKIEYIIGFTFPWKVAVFTLSTGTWSILSTNLPRESIRDLEMLPQVVIDRFIYWFAFDTLAAKGSRSQYLIISFDLTAKEFKEINFTGSLTNQLYCIQTISKLRESLVVLACHGEYEEDVVCGLWMMKEQGISKSFTKLYTINLPGSITQRLLGFRKTGDLILETEQHNEQTGLEIYEPSSEAIDNLGIDGEDYSLFMCYMETLLLQDQLDGFIYSISN